MIKTIEEAAEKFVAEYYDLGEYGDEVSDIEIDNSEECFIGGAEYVMSLPFAKRLTEQEKERVREEYAKTYPNDIDRGVTSICVAAAVFSYFLIAVAVVSIIYAVYLFWSQFFE